MVTPQQRLHLLLSRDDLAATVRRLAEEVRRDYAGQRPVLVGVLRGAFVFLADLVRELDMPVEVDFVRAASYRGGRSTGRVRLLEGLDTDIAGRHVLLVEDILDTGRTTRWLLRYLQRRGPASLRLCALLDKAEARLVPVQPDYVGRVIPNVYVVGYGLDLDQDLRHLPAVYALEGGDGAGAHGAGAGAPLPGHPPAP